MTNTRNTQTDFTFDGWEAPSTQREGLPALINAQCARYERASRRFNNSPLGPITAAAEKEMDRIFRALLRRGWVITPADRDADGNLGYTARQAATK